MLLFIRPTMGMGIQSWEWKGMGSKKSFPHIFTVKIFIE